MKLYVRSSTNSTAQLASVFAQDLGNLFKSNLSKFDLRISSKYHIYDDTSFDITCILKYSDGTYDSLSVEYDTNENSFLFYNVLSDYSSANYRVSERLDQIDFSGPIPRNCPDVSHLPFKWNNIRSYVSNRIDLVNRYTPKTRSRSNLSNSNLLRMLDQYGISTSPKSQYTIEYYVMDHVQGKIHKYTTSFSADGDWLACFGLLLKSAPTAKNLSNYFGSNYLDEIENIAMDYPTTQSLLSGPASEWANPDEYEWVETFTNVSNNTVLYSVDTDWDELQEEFEID